MSTGPFGGGRFVVDYLTGIEQQGDGSWQVVSVQTTLEFMTPELSFYPGFTGIDIFEFGTLGSFDCEEPVGGNVNVLVVSNNTSFWNPTSSNRSGTTSELVGLSTNGGDPILIRYAGDSVYYIASQVDRYNVGETVEFATSGTWTYCFAAGTGIATPCGETMVEALQIGDLVTTEDGRAVPVRWIGRQTVHRMFSGERACPVRVRAGALGDGLPHRDLVLTSDHALVLDGYAINAGALVNGTTISFNPAPEQATYYHVETEDHDVILANGTPTETYLDNNDRRSFDNYSDYAARYGENQITTELPYPRVTSARLLPEHLCRKLCLPKAA